MIKIKFCLRMLIIFLNVTYAFACDVNKAEPYPPVPVAGGFIVFGSMPVLEDEGKSDPDMGWGVSFLDCSTGVSKFISRLPFIADPGAVQDAFLATAPGDNEYLFIIHSAPIRARTGVRYGSDYFSVIVFRRDESGFNINGRLTSYFGSGADTLSQQADEDNIVYAFPYKNREEIISKLASKSFHHWWIGDSPELTILRKTSIYSSQTIVADTGMYLVSGDKVKREAVSAGWLSILYKTVKGRDIRGWILCKDVNGC